jgi:hypothetical protein
VCNNVEPKLRTCHVSQRTEIIPPVLFKPVIIKKLNLKLPVAADLQNGNASGIESARFTKVDLIQQKGAGVARNGGG